ncbi:TetR/AcrR family transcriptional regulator [Amaricoccus sp.]|uniref:TetR/AcrR family transcriptional regulator n=1 Tax=Amaricoccus sp. TaxID=1872485 RepID=UPI001B446A27|nr:TetR/AcrR family transcriptional regulator [Amaricoccus sp.]MBP7243278.1 TetR/AcrR family transcriptional regulator [Amaricoccus sp.]
MTEGRIMEGVASLLRRGSEVTFDLVARESGVPQRTLYRYFENREALFGAFWRWANELIETPAPPATPEEVVAHIPALFAAFDRDEALVRAMMHDPHGQAVRHANADARRRKFSDALKPVIEKLPEAEAAWLLASVTVLCSATGWESMKDNWALSGGASAQAAQWAAKALIDDARRRTGASLPVGRAKEDVVTGDSVP